MFPPTSFSMALKRGCFKVCLLFTVSYIKRLSKSNNAEKLAKFCEKFMKWNRLVYFIWRFAKFIIWWYVGCFDFQIGSLYVYPSVCSCLSQTVCLQACTICTCSFVWLDGQTVSSVSLSLCYSVSSSVLCISLWLSVFFSFLSLCSLSTRQSVFLLFDMPVCLTYCSLICVVCLPACLPACLRACLRAWL